MKRCAGLAAGVCLILLCVGIYFGAGGSDVPESSAVSVGRKGRITAWFVEDFAEDYYSIEELAQMAKREAAEYNARIPGKKTAVKVEKVKQLPEDSGKIMVSYRFDGWKSYTDFNGVNFFYGTVEEAAAEGLGAGAVLKSLADGSLSAGDRLSRATDSYVIFTDVKANVYCPGEVTHISEGASVNEDGSIDTSGAEGTVYILMK